MIQISKDELRIKLPKIVQHERKVLAVVLEHIAEVDRRRYFFEWGHASLFDYLTKELNYSEASAYRRMNAARALRQMPEMKSDIEEGTLNLSHITMAHSSIRQEERSTGEKIQPEIRRNIYEALKSTTKIEAQRILDEKLPVHDIVPPVVEKHKRNESVELKLVLPEEVYAQLKQARAFYSHVLPDGNWVDFLELMAKDVIKLRDPAYRLKKQLIEAQTQSNMTV